MENNKQTRLPVLVQSIKIVICSFLAIFGIILIQLLFDLYLGKEMRMGFWGNLMLTSIIALLCFIPFNNLFLIVLHHTRLLPYVIYSEKIVFLKVECIIFC